MEETAKERAARRWRESQAPTEAPKAEPASVAPLSSKEAAPSDWFAASAFDASARAIADTQYVFAGAFVAHHYLRDAMRRADRTAAAASIGTRPLGSDDDDIDKARQPQHAPTLTPTPSLTLALAPRPGVVLPRQLAPAGAARRAAPHLAHAHPRGAGPEGRRWPLLHRRGEVSEGGATERLLHRRRRPGGLLLLRRLCRF